MREPPVTGEAGQRMLSKDESGLHTEDLKHFRPKASSRDAVAVRAKGLATK